MPIKVSSHTYIGNGKIGVEDRLSKSGFRYVGGSLELSLTIESEEKTTPNLEDSSGGNLNKLTRISKVSGSLQLQEFKARNLAMALRANYIEEIGQPIVGESKTLFSGSLMMFDKLVDYSQPITIETDGQMWEASKAYVLDSVIIVDDVIYVCTTAGVSDASQPVFDDTVGSITVDNAASWKCLGS